MLPEEGNRPALEGEDEEEVHAVYLDSKQRSPENDAMNSLLGDAQQEDTDAGFEKDVRDNISRFAGPPPLLRVNINVGYNMIMLLHTFIPTGYFSSGIRYRRFPVPFEIPRRARVQKTKNETSVRTEQ